MVGSVILRVWHGDHRCKLDCKVVDNTNIHPLLGRRACLGMKIMSYLHNDKLHKPTMGHVAVYSLEDTIPVSKEQLCKKHAKVFK